MLWDGENFCCGCVLMLTGKFGSKCSDQRYISSRTDCGDFELGLSTAYFPLS